MEAETTLGKIREVLFMIAAISFYISVIFAPVSGAVAVLATPQETAYEHTVKTEQVYDGRAIDQNDTVAFEDLSSDEQEVLHRAFKKTDHFAGESEVVVTASQEYDTFDGWKVIEVDGVRLIVAVSVEQVSQYQFDEVFWDDIFFLSVLIAIISIALAIALEPRGYQSGY